MLRRVASRAGGLAAVLALVPAGVAFAAAGGRETVTETEHARNEVLFSREGANPCTGEPGTLTAIITNSVFHVTFFENGDESWVTGTDEGTVTLTPSNPSGVFASGHFTQWFGGASNNKNEVESFTSTFNLKGSDGSHIRVQGKSHTSTNASGVVAVSFEIHEVRCG
jgi:hypothetical protein